MRRTLHASVALETGAELVLGINPLVPFDAALATTNHRKVPDSLVDNGLPAVLSQTFRTMLKSRMQVGLDKYQKTHERADLLVFEPSPDDVEMFFTNPFSYTMRHHDDVVLAGEVAVHRAGRQARLGNDLFHRRRLHALAVEAAPGGIEDLRLARGTVFVADFRHGPHASRAATKKE